GTAADPVAEAGAQAPSDRPDLPREAADPLEPPQPLEPPHPHDPSRPHDPGDPAGQETEIAAPHEPAAHPEATDGRTDVKDGEHDGR
ncbi:MAG: hypothetical protein Q7T71_10135, partial [Herbiconiux sp.]|nr:hypothetical protein [Herbiconiux sp.]